MAQPLVLHHPEHLERRRQPLAPSRMRMMVGGDDDDGGGGAVLSSNRSGNWPGAQQLPQNSARSLASLPSRQPEPLHVGGIFTTCRATPASWQRTPFATSSRQPPWQRKGRMVGCPLPQSCAPICTMRGRSAPPPALSGARPSFGDFFEPLRVSKHDESLQKSPMPLKKVSKRAAL